MSLKIELERDSGTKSSIRIRVIGFFFPVALINLSISFDSCQRFGPTLSPKKFASDWPITPSFC